VATVPQLRKIITRLEAENAYLKKIVARESRKAEHGCADGNCSLCDPERPEDSTWKVKNVR
jgi:hypothetical protein